MDQAFSRDLTREVAPPAVALRFGLSATERAGALGWWRGRRPHHDKTGAGSDQALFDALRDRLEAENRQRIAPAQRLRQAEGAAQRIAAPVHTLLSNAAKDRNGVPEPIALRALLDAVDGCLGGLGNSLRLVLQDARAAGRQRAVETLLTTAACRLMELIHCRQRLRLRRHQRLSSPDWQGANMVFTAIAGLGETETPVRALLSPPSARDTDGNISLLSLYLDIQIAGLFDICAWPLPYQHVIDVYAHQVELAMTVRFAQRPARRSGLRFTHQHLSEPARPAPMGNTTIVLDITRLLAAVNTDWNHRNDVSSAGWRPALAERSPATRFAVLRLMTRDLGIDTGDDPAVPMVSVNEALRMQIGMEDVRNHLQSIYAGSGLARERAQLFDAFSGSSAAMGDDHASAEDAQWRITASGRSGLAARTKETRWTRPLRVGTPAVIGIGNRGLQQPRLGYIDRIERDTQGLIQVRLCVLARFATLVRVRNADIDRVRAAHIDRLNCLLLYDDSKGWSLLTPTQTRFGAGSRVVIRTKRLRAEVRLRELRVSTPELMLFALRESDLSLGTPRYPGARSHPRRPGGAAKRTGGGSTEDGARLVSLCG